MGDVIILTVIRVERDGEKARIKRRRSMLVDREYGVSQMPRYADSAATAPCELSDLRAIAWAVLLVRRASYSLVTDAK